ncbi:hypothetical protein [Salinisphaera hydrothermalis]|uniref:hypothetical protein n=1 Tax=Salinisphaera hydrothermalis TaxID=563188 RepID=UPI0033409962
MLDGREYDRYTRAGVWMAWGTILQNIVGTVMSFVVWSALVYGFFVLRNKSLEFKLKRLIRPERSDPDENRVHIVCANGTDVRVTVRDVRLITASDTHISLTYFGDTGDVIRPRRNNDIIARRRNSVVTRHERAGLIERNFVELPAQTAGLWALTAEQVEDPNWRFAHLILVLDYPTLLNTRRLMVVEAREEILGALNDDFRRYILATRFPGQRRAQPELASESDDGGRY